MNPLFDGAQPWWASLTNVTALAVLQELHKVSNKKIAIDLQRFFKTQPGEYAAGDIFLGIKIPVTRTIAKRYENLTLKELSQLASSEFHEARFCALVILVNRYKKAKSREEERKYFDFYMGQLNRGNINNWDLVDVSAPTIGRYLLNEKSSLDLLLKMARSKDLWVRRTSILFTFASLAIGETKPTKKLSTALLEDDHDLIQKAVGWALREVGKINPDELRAFLKKNGRQMSRTTLRYAIEKFSAKERKSWLESTR